MSNQLPGQYVPKNQREQQGQPGNQAQPGNPAQQTSQGTAEMEELMLQRQRNKNKRNKILMWVLVGVLVVIVIVLTTLIFTGVTDPRVARLENTVANKELQIQQQQDRIEELNQAVADTTVSEVVPTTSLQSVEGKDVPEFFLVEGRFVAPKALKIETTFDDVNNSYVQVGSKFKFTPSNKWIMSVDGANLEFSHPVGIWGKVRALGHDDLIVEADMKPMVQEFFKGYPKTTITYRKIFMEDDVSGMMGSAKITVKETKESKEGTLMTVNVGFAQRGDYTISFMFLSKDDSGVAQELVDLLLSSCTFGDSKLKLE